MPQTAEQLCNGVRPSYLKAFMQRYDTFKETTKEIVDDCIREQCRAENAPFFDCKEIPEQVKEHAESGKPTVFVSPAWGAKFDTLVAGIERFLVCTDLKRRQTICGLTYSSLIKQNAAEGLHVFRKSVV